MEPEKQPRPKKRAASEPDDLDDPQKSQKMEDFFVKKYERLLAEEGERQEPPHVVQPREDQLEKVLKGLGMEGELLEKAMQESAKLPKEI
jgi:hypothetical protein